MKANAVLLTILLACAGLAVQCRERPSPEAPPPEATSEAVARVTVTPVRQGPVYRAYTAVGTLAPWDLARITPKVTGRIDSIAVDEGDRVEQGELLMQIDRFDYERVVENAVALRNQARVSREKAMRDFSRIDRLYRDQTVSEQRHRDMKTAFDLAAYAHDQAVVALKKAERDLRECRVIAPISGVITGKHANEGELTGPQVLAFVIMQMDKVKVEVDLPEDAYGYVKTGNLCRITVDAIPDERFEGTIAMIHPTIDPVSRTVKITISLKNPEVILRSGMTARAKVIQRARENSLYAPEKAFVTGEEGYFVYRLVAGRVQRVPVDSGVHGDGVLEITSGLSAGDQVVIEGLTGLRDGMAVKAKPTETVDPDQSRPGGLPLPPMSSRSG